MKNQHWRTIGLMTSVLAFTGTISSANAQSVSWTRINSVPPTTQKIAACPNGAMYALRSGSRVTVNRTGGRGADWQPINVTIPTDTNAVTNILCAGNKLHLLKRNRLFRNDGTDVAPQWVDAGSFRDQGTDITPLAVSGASLNIGRANLPEYFALFASSDGTALLKAPLALQHSRRIGLPHSAAAIAGAGDSLGTSDRLAKVSRVFALNTDRTLWLNSGPGCDSTWRRIDYPFATEEITARSVDQIYALNTDKSLWEGQVRRTVSTVSLGNSEVSLINQLALRGTQVALDRKPGSNDMELKIIPSRLLQNTGLNAVEENLGTKMVPGILGARHAVWISNLKSNNLQFRLTRDAIVLEIDFAPGGKVTVDTLIRGNWDIQNAKLTLTLGIDHDSCGRSYLTLRSTRFDARLSGDVAGSFIGNFNDVRAQLEAAMNDKLSEFFRKPEVANSFRTVLVQAVPQLPSSAFSTPRPANPPHTLIGQTTGIRTGRFTYTVEGD